jgi:hypothetical protein
VTMTKDPTVTSPAGPETKKLDINHLFPSQQGGTTQNEDGSSPSGSRTILRATIERDEQFDRDVLAVAMATNPKNSGDHSIVTQRYGAVPTGQWKDRIKKSGQLMDRLIQAGAKATPPVDLRMNDVSASQDYATWFVENFNATYPGITCYWREYVDLVPTFLDKDGQVQKGNNPLSGKTLLPAEYLGRVSDETLDELVALIPEPSKEDQDEIKTQFVKRLEGKTIPEVQTMVARFASFSSQEWAKLVEDGSIFKSMELNGAITIDSDGVIHLKA